MKKHLKISWDGVNDSTGYLFSFAKSLCAAVKNSPYAEFAEDIVATSGFAFRMWVAPGLCPSAASIWNFDDQKTWVEKGGLSCGYVGRYWGQDDIEEEKRLEAVNIIRQSIDRGIPAVSWDIGVTEWGLITGYDDDDKLFDVLSVTGTADKMSYEVLGKREIPILSVLTVTGITGAGHEEIMENTLKTAISHLKGEEWCENAKGLEAYPALIKHFNGDFDPNISWNMEYYLGTYGALKYYAYRYFDKAGLTELAGIYNRVFESWKKAFEIKKNRDISDAEVRNKIAASLTSAYENEKSAVNLMKNNLTI